MSIPSRHADPQSRIAEARTFFVTSSIAGRRCLLQSERSASLLIEVLYEYRAQGKFRVHEFVVMPNHFHVLLTVDDLSVERAVQFIKGGFSFRAGKAFGLKGAIWQKGFSDSRITGAAAYEARRKYIHNNPVAERLSATPADYPFSSAHPGFELDPAPQGLKPAKAAAASGGTP